MSANIHASCVAIGGKGVLILGASGSGKSDLALRLIDEGASLIADDRCEIFLKGKNLCARPPASIAGLLEMRGIGIIALPFRSTTRLAMAVRLAPPQQKRPRQRLPRPAFWRVLQGTGKLPLIVVNGFEASATARIRAALTAFSTNSFRDTFNPS